ncbi:MAG TPA: hypothetical protein VIF62_36905 [Labilithrix sp.]|jgi:hypothetical protein
MKRLLPLLALLLLGCTDEAIVLASIPESASDGGSHPTPRKCVVTSDCGEGQICEKKDCDDRQGVCEPHPALCGNEEHVVCGCDGVTYFNDCLRKVASVAPLYEGECESEARPCNASAPCPAGGTCAVLLGFDVASCSETAPGTCWAVPSTCPAPRDTETDRWSACDEDGLPCATTCQAVTGKPYFRVMRCSGP